MTTKSGVTVEAETEKKDNSFDISGGMFDTVSACNAGFELRLLNPFTEKPTDGYITLIGKHSDQFTEFVRERQDARAIMEAALIRKGQNVPVKSVEAIQNDNIELVAFAIFSSGVPWRGITDKRVELPWTLPNIRKVLKKSPAIYEQCNNAAGELLNFMPKSQEL